MVRMQNQIARARSKRDKMSSVQIRKEKYKRAALCLFGVVSGISAVVGHLSQYLNKKAMHTSILTGQKWVDKLLTGNFFLFCLIITIKNNCRTCSGFLKNDGDESICFSPLGTGIGDPNVAMSCVPSRNFRTWT